MALSASSSRPDRQFINTAAHARSSPDREQRLRNYIRRHTDEDVDVILTGGVSTAAVVPATEAALVEDDQTDLENRQAKRLTENTDGDYLVLITTNPTSLEKLNTITRQTHADLNKQFGLALHELLHILHTDVGATTGAIRDRVDEEYRDKVHRLFNAIEDGAIEHSVFESEKWTPRAANRLITVRTAQALTVDDLNTPVEYSLWDAIDSTVYERAISDEGKIDVLRDSTDPRIQFRSDSEQQVYEHIYPTLEEFIFAARSKPTSIQRVEAVIDFWKSTLKPIFDGERNRQEQNSNKGDANENAEEQQPGSQTPTPPTPENGEDESNEENQEPGGPPDTYDGGEPDNSEETDADAEPDTDDSPDNRSERGDEEVETDNENQPNSSETGAPLDSMPDNIDLGEITADSEAGQTRSDVGQPIEDMPDIGSDNPVTPGQGPQDSGSEPDSDKPDDSESNPQTDDTDSKSDSENGSSDTTEQEVTAEKNDKNIDQEGSDQAENNGGNVGSRDNHQSSLTEFANTESPVEANGSENIDSESDTTETIADEEPDSDGPSNEAPNQDSQHDDVGTDAEPERDEPPTNTNEPAIPDSGVDEKVAEEVADEVAKKESQSGPNADDLEQELKEIKRSLQGSENAGPGSLDELLEGSEATQSVSNKRWNRIRNEADHVKQYLKKALEKSANDSTRAGLTSGRPDRRQLGRLGMGDPHGFAIDLPGDDKQYDIVFVLDGSGSMAGNKMFTATEAIARLSLAAEELGVNVAVTRFRNDKAELVKPFSVETEFVRDKILDPYARGRTPLADALTLARELLQNQKQSGHRPLIITLTDGIPDDVDAVREEIRRTHAPVQSLTIATDKAPSDPPEKAESLERYWAGHTYVFDESNLERRLENFIARLAGV